MTRLQKMRIIAIPLTRPNPKSPKISGATFNRLTYYQFQISAKKLKSDSVKKDGADSEKKGWLPEDGVANWVTQKAADIWTGFGKAQGGWKLKTFQFGEKLVDRMEFEELALKSVDPSMGPSISQLKRSPVLDEKDPVTIPLVYPPSEMLPSMALAELSAYTAHRIPRHRKGFFLWMAIAPLTAPFMIIPIIPNLPFFFCVWRSWSHYRGVDSFSLCTEFLRVDFKTESTAYKSSQYLQSLIQHNLIVPESNEGLDQVYNMYEPSEAPSTATLEADPAEDQTSSGSTNEASPNSSAEPQHTLLLNRDAVPALLSLFEFKPESTAASDLYRAVEQARVRVSSRRTQL